MEHQRITPAAIVETPDPLPAQQDRWTREKQAEFLRTLAATRCVAEATRHVEMSRQSAYRLRNRREADDITLIHPDWSSGRQSP